MYLVRRCARHGESHGQGATTHSGCPALLCVRVNGPQVALQCGREDFVDERERAPLVPEQVLAPPERPWQPKLPAQVACTGSEIKLPQVAGLTPSRPHGQSPSSSVLCKPVLKSTDTRALIVAQKTGAQKRASARRASCRKIRTGCRGKALCAPPTAMPRLAALCLLDMHPPAADSPQSELKWKTLAIHTDVCYALN